MENSDHNQGDDDDQHTSDVYHEDKISNSHTSPDEHTDTSYREDRNIDTGYDRGEDDETIETGTITSKLYTKDYLLRHPTNVEKLSYTWFLQHSLRKANLNEDDPPAGATDQTQRKIEKEFFNSILQYAPNALKSSGIKIPDNLEYEEEILNHLISKVGAYSPGELSRFKQRVGFSEEITSEKPLLNPSESLETDRGQVTWGETRPYERLDETALRILYAAYRMGANFPDTVRENHLEQDKEESPIVKENELEEAEIDEIPQPMINSSGQNKLGLSDHKISSI